MYVTLKGIYFEILVIGCIFIICMSHNVPPPPPHTHTRIHTYNVHVHLPLQAIIKANNLEICCPRQCFINNEFLDASDGKTYQTINPTDEAAICELAASGVEDVEKAIKAAKVR